MKWFQTLLTIAGYQTRESDQPQYPLRMSFVSELGGLEWIGSTERNPWVSFHIKANTVLIFDDLPLNIEAFKQSGSGSGQYLLYICMCGDPGCDGVFVDMEHGNGIVRWQAAWKANGVGQAGDKIHDFAYTFNADEYARAIGEMQAQITYFTSRFGPNKIDFLGVQRVYYDNRS